MKWLGWALLITGAAGSYYRYTLWQASSQGNPGLANNSLKPLDPAGLFGLQPGGGFFDLPMGVDIAVLLVGLTLVTRKRLL